MIAKKDTENDDIQKDNKFRTFKICISLKDNI